MIQKNGSEVKTQALANQGKSNSLSITREQLSEHSLARMLMLASQMKGRQVLEDEVRFWKEALRGNSPQAIEAAFTAHLLSSDFFPSPSEIAKQIALYQERRSFEKGEQEFQEFKAKQQKYVADGGELLSFQGLIAKFQKIAGKSIIGKIEPIPGEDVWSTPLNLSSDRKNDAQRRLAEWQEKRKAR